MKLLDFTGTYTAGSGLGNGDFDDDRPSSVCFFTEDAYTDTTRLNLFHFNGAEVIGGPTPVTRPSDDETVGCLATHMDDNSDILVLYNHGTEVYQALFSNDLQLIFDLDVNFRSADDHPHGMMRRDYELIFFDDWGETNTRAMTTSDSMTGYWTDLWRGNDIPARQVRELVDDAAHRRIYTACDRSEVYQFWRGLLTSGIICSRRTGGRNR